VISEEIAISHIFTETRFYMGYIPVGDSIGLTLATDVIGLKAFRVQ